MTEHGEIEEALDNAYKARRVKLENDAIKHLKKDQKFFYTYAKIFTKTDSERAAFTTKEGKLTSNPFVQSKMLRHQYESVASKAMVEFEVKSDDAFFMCDTSRMRSRWRASRTR